MRGYRLRLALVAMLLGGLSPLPASAQAVKQDEAAAIRAVLSAQVAAWNRGDIPAFMSGYDDSPETTFVGAAAVRKGFKPILENYKKGYTGKDQMGTLTFQDLDIRVLPSTSGDIEYAVVTGRFHLDRTSKGSATRDDGIFSLVWHKGPGGWKIVLDHTA